MIREFLRQILMLIGTLSILAVCFWPLLLVFGMFTSNICAFVHSMFILLVFGVFISIISFTLANII